MSTNTGRAMKEQTEHLEKLRAERAHRVRVLLDEGLSVTVIKARLGLSKSYTMKKLLQIAGRVSVTTPTCLVQAKSTPLSDKQPL